MDEMKLMGSSKFDKLRRVSIVKPVAEYLGLKEGDTVEYHISDDHVIISKKFYNSISIPGDLPEEAHYLISEFVRSVSQNKPSKAINDLLNEAKKIMPKEEWELLIRQAESGE